MTSLIDSFAGGICFGLGAVFAVVVCSFVVRRNDKTWYADARAHYKAVEDRLRAQADAVVKIAVMLENTDKKP